jgi:pyruvate dehydrogenase E2 component (dihydrolipoamide acetyltransferase)
MEMEAYDAGVLTRILVEEGASVPIGTPIAVIGDAGTAPAGAAAQSPLPAPDHSERPLLPPPAPPLLEPAPSAGQVPASPLARECGVELSTISGSGPGGRVVRADIEEAARLRDTAQPRPQPAAAPAEPTPPAPGSHPAALPAAAAPPVPVPAATFPLAPAADAEEIPLTTVRRLTAQRLAASAREAPHF